MPDTLVISESGSAALQHPAGTLEQGSSTLRKTIGELEVFSYSVAHDMRAPLRAMQSFSKLIDTVGLESELGHGTTFWLEMQTAELNGQRTG